MLKIPIDTKSAQIAVNRLEKDLKSLGRSTEKTDKEFKQLEARLRKRVGADQAKRSINGITKSLKMSRFEAMRFKASVGDLSGAFRSFTGILGKVGKGLFNLKTMMVGIGIAVVLGDIIRVGAKFEKTMAGVKGVTGATAKEFKALTGIAKKMGETTEFTASQAAEGLKFLAMAGFGVEKSIAALPGVLNLATAGQLELGEAADIVSNALTAMRLEVEELDLVNDTFIKTITTSNTDVRMLAESFKYSAPLAAGLGYNIIELSSWIGLLGNAGIQGSMAGTQLNAAFARLPKLFRKYGEDIKDATGKTKGMADAVELLEKRGASAEEVLKLFQQRGGRAMLAFMGMGAEVMREYEQVIKESEGANRELAETMRSTTIGAFKELMSALEGVKLDIFGNQTGDLNEIIKELTQTVRDNKDEIISFISNLSEAVYTLGKGFVFTLDKAVGFINWLDKAEAARQLVSVGAITRGEQILWTESTQGIKGLIKVWKELGYEGIKYETNLLNIKARIKEIKREIKEFEGREKGIIFPLGFDPETKKGAFVELEEELARLQSIVDAKPIKLTILDPFDPSAMAEKMGQYSGAALPEKLETRVWRLKKQAEEAGKEAERVYKENIARIEAEEKAEAEIKKKFWKQTYEDADKLRKQHDALAVISGRKRLDADIIATKIINDIERKELKERKEQEEEISQNLLKLQEERIKKEKEVLEESLRDQRLIYENFLGGIQTNFVDFFEQLYSGQLDSWQELVDSMKSTFIRMLAEITAKQFTANIVASVTGMGGASAGGGSNILGWIQKAFGFAGSIGTVGTTAGVAGSLTGSGLTGVGTGGMYAPAASTAAASAAGSAAGMSALTGIGLVALPVVYGMWETSRQRDARFHFPKTVYSEPYRYISQYEQDQGVTRRTKRQVPWSAIGQYTPGAGYESVSRIEGYGEKGYGGDIVKVLEAMYTDAISMANFYDRITGGKAGKTFTLTPHKQFFKIKDAEKELGELGRQWADTVWNVFESAFEKMGFKSMQALARGIEKEKDVLGKAFQTALQTSSWLSFESSIAEQIYNTISEKLTRKLIEDRAFQGALIPVYGQINKAFRRASKGDGFDFGLFRQDISGVGGLLGTSFADLKPAFDEITNLGQMLREMFVGSFAAGGIVPQTGLAMVHEGEEISSQGSKMSLTIQADVITTDNVRGWIREVLEDQENYREGRPLQRFDLQTAGINVS